MQSRRNGRKIWSDRKERGNYEITKEGNEGRQRSNEARGKKEKGKRRERKESNEERKE